MDDNRHEYEVYSLVLKQDAKELDARYFNAREKAQFNEADEADWRQWIKKVITTVDKRTEKDILSNKIITAPMRMVRVNKGTTPAFEAKSRLVVPGHVDPQIGLFRVDSPTTSPLISLASSSNLISPS